MNRNSEERLQRLLGRVEKEERRQEKITENPGAIRRALLVDEPISEYLDNQYSDDETNDSLEIQKEGTDSGEEDVYSFRLE